MLAVLAGQGERGTRGDAVGGRVGAEMGAGVVGGGAWVSRVLKRPVGRPSYKPVVWYKSFLYQAASWKRERRVVAKVEFHAS